MCGPGCGYCGRCTAPWDEDPREREPEDDPAAELAEYETFEQIYLAEHTEPGAC